MIEELGVGGGGTFVFLVKPRDAKTKEVVPIVIAGGGGSAQKNPGQDGNKTNFICHVI